MSSKSQLLGYTPFFKNGVSTFCVSENNNCWGVSENNKKWTHQNLEKWVHNGNVMSHWQGLLGDPKSSPSYPWRPHGGPTVTRLQGLHLWHQLCRRPGNFGLNQAISRFRSLEHTYSFNMTEKYCEIPEQCQIEQFSGSLFTALWVLPLATERKEFQLRFSFFNESCRRMAWKRFSVNRVVGTWNAKLRTQFLTTWGCSSS